mmetsp:Transcript_50565/g.146733  ORF Transcript_50565/g.146733 Transcript_50565/m.146733 type:complete len:230 (+) Transcript_50565:852-1541(+)
MRTGAVDHTKQEDDGENRGRRVDVRLVVELVLHRGDDVHEVLLHLRQVLLLFADQRAIRTASPVKGSKRHDEVLHDVCGVADLEQLHEDHDEAEDPQKAIASGLQHARPMDFFERLVDLDLLPGGRHHVHDDEEEDHEARHEAADDLGAVRASHCDEVLDDTVHDHSALARVKLDPQHGGDLELHGVEERQELHILRESVQEGVCSPDRHLALAIIIQLVPDKDRVVGD